jgi:hypothetical protein
MSGTNASEPAAAITSGPGACSTADTAFAASMMLSRTSGAAASTAIGGNGRGPWRSSSWAQSSDVTASVPATSGMRTARLSSI